MVIGMHRSLVVKFLKIQYVSLRFEPRYKPCMFTALQYFKIRMIYFEFRYLPTKSQ
jgi:hypothetical protein